MIPDIQKNIKKLKTLSGYDDATEDLEVMSHISIFCLLADVQYQYRSASVYVCYLFIY